MSFISISFSLPLTASLTPASGENCFLRSRKHIINIVGRNQGSLFLKNQLPFQQAQFIINDTEQNFIYERKLPSSAQAGFSLSFDFPHKPPPPPFPQPKTHFTFF